MIENKVKYEINFYEELNKLLKENDEELENENVCLITNTLLNDTKIKLECGHSFNYLPLYRDIKNHKNKFNNMEIKGLKPSQIRCPYCRNIQNILLPYIELDGVEKIHGINYFDENYHKYYNMFIGECCFKCKNPVYDETKDENDITNPKIIKCEQINVTKLKENGNDYCSKHKYLAEKQILKEEKNKLKQILKEAKIKEKMEKEAKIKEKMEKMNSVKIELCVAILKSGNNKGLPCGKKAFENNTCKRHLHS
jgi:hypothetical protein